MRALMMIAILMCSAAGLVQAQNAAFGLSSSAEAWTEETTNIDPGMGPFNVYVYAMTDQVHSIAAYEMGIDIDNDGVFVLGADGPHGWTNFGSYTNHMAGFITPVPVGADEQVLVCTLSLLYSGTEPVMISIGPSEPSSVNGAGAVLVDGNDVDNVIFGYPACSWGEPWGPAMTLHGEGICGVVAVEGRSWTAVKQLFD